MRAGQQEARRLREEQKTEQFNFKIRRKRKNQIDPS